MRELVIYECGRMNGLTTNQMRAWRDYFKTAIMQVAENVGANLKVINPCDYYSFDVKRHQTESEIMKYDLARVKESDLVVVNLEGLNVSVGSMIECYEAWKMTFLFLHSVANKIMKVYIRGRNVALQDEIKITENVLIT